MAKRNKLQPQQIDEVVDLFVDKKLKVPVIARSLGVSPGCIEYQLLRHGVDPWKPWRRKNQCGGRPFSQTEDERVLELLSKPMPLKHVARAMGRPRTSVLMRVMTLEARAEAALGGS